MLDYRHAEAQIDFGHGNGRPQTSASPPTSSTSCAETSMTAVPSGSSQAALQPHRAPPVRLAVVLLYAGHLM